MCSSSFLNLLRSKHEHVDGDNAIVVWLPVALARQAYTSFVYVVKVVRLRKSGMIPVKVGDASSCRIGVNAHHSPNL